VGNWSGVSSTGIAAGDLADESVKAVDTSSFWQKHERALAGDDVDTALLAEGNRFCAD